MGAVEHYQDELHDSICLVFATNKSEHPSASP